MKRKVKIIFGIGVPVGILLLVVKNIFDIEDGDFFKQYLILGAVVIAIAVLINCLYQVRFIQKLNSISNRVSKTGDIDELIRALEILLGQSKSDFRKSLILINLSYGYSKKKEYQKGLEVLESINPKTVKGINQIIYLLNIVSFHFYLEHYEEVIEITERHENVFTKFMGHPQLGWTVAVNTICYHIAKGDKNTAKALLEEARAKWAGAEMQEEWEFLDSKLHESEAVLDMEENKE